VAALGLEPADPVEMRPPPRQAEPREVMEQVEAEMPAAETPQQDHRPRETTPSLPFLV